MSETPFVELRGLRKEFRLRRPGWRGGHAQTVAVDDVSFTIRKGETFGLVGESGSGKTTVARMLLKLEKPTAGAIHVEGHDIFRQDAGEERAYRRLMQAVLQDPYGALSPRMKVGGIVAEPLREQGASQDEIERKLPGLLAMVGLPADAAHRYPHQFSGGQRQRIAISRALSVDPRFLVLDEPVSALDVSIRAQVLVLLREMQARLGLTYLFIGHDLAIVRYISTSVGVMYFGRMVEIGGADAVLRRPLHPYTRRLVAVASMREPLGRQRLTGEMPNPLAPPSGCHFRLRCAYATAQCASEVPPLREAGNGQRVACHHVEAIERGEKAETGPLLEMTAN